MKSFELLAGNDAGDRFTRVGCIILNMSPIFLELFLIRKFCNVNKN